MTTLKDALYNMHPDSGTDPDYARGILVGAVAAVMEFEKIGFSEAIEFIAPYLPHAIMTDAIPKSWQTEIGIYRTHVSD